MRTQTVNASRAHPRDIPLWTKRPLQRRGGARSTWPVPRLVFALTMLLVLAWFAFVVAGAGLHSIFAA